MRLLWNFLDIKKYRITDQEAISIKSGYLYKKGMCLLRTIYTKSITSVYKWEK